MSGPRLANVTPWVRNELMRLRLRTPAVNEDVLVYLSAKSARGPWMARVLAPERDDEGAMQTVEVVRRVDNDLRRLIEELPL